MKIISHRGLWTESSQQNSLSAFVKSQEHQFGIETDLRSFRGQLVLSHDPVIDSEGLVSFESLLEIWLKRPDLPLFINIKEDGLIPLLKRFDPVIRNLNLVFFDMSLPQLLKFSENYPKTMLATRYSEYERTPIATQFCSWLWVDGFCQDPDLQSLKHFYVEEQMNLAIVSPEIHSRSPVSAWKVLAEAFSKKSQNWVLCTDLPLDAKQEGL